MADHQISTGAHRSLFSRDVQCVRTWSMGPAVFQTGNCGNVHMKTRLKFSLSADNDSFLPWPFRTNWFSVHPIQVLGEEILKQEKSSIHETTEGPFVSSSRNGVVHQYPHHFTR